MMNLGTSLRIGWPVLAAGVWLALSASASELVYTPVNPTFGGSPGNAAGLLANATAQNDHKAPAPPRTPRAEPKTPLERFNQQLESAVLSRLSSSAVVGLFDERTNQLKDGTVTAGNYIITIKTTEHGIELTTSDQTIPGSSTTILVGNVPALQ